MKLYKKDINNIGQSTYSENGFATFILSSATANIEEILLREILELFNCKIMSTEDHIWTDDKGKEIFDTAIKTNLPWEVYTELFE